MMVKCSVFSKAERANGVVTILRPEGARSGSNYLNNTHTPGTAFFRDNHQKEKWRNEDHELTLLLPSDLLISDKMNPKAEGRESSLRSASELHVLIWDTEQNGNR